MEKCQQIIKDNTESVHLRMYLSQLCSITTHKISRNKELQILLLGFIANTFGTNMLDPLDKPQSLIKTITRVLDQICLHMKENSPLVHQACGKSFVDIFNYCVPNKTERKTISLMFYERLDAIILGGSDKIAQKAACFALCQFIKHIIDNKLDVLCEFFCPKIVGLFIKTRCFHFELTRSLIYLLDYIGIKYYVGCLSEIIEKTSEIILDERIPIYQDKIEACALLTVLGCNLDPVCDLVNKYYMTDVLRILNDASQNRVAKVQKAARDAKEIWDNLKIKGDEVSFSKQEAEQLDPNSIVTPDDLIKVKSGFGNVADAKTLGYLRNKSRSRPRKAHRNKLQEKRSRSKQLNSSK